MSPELDRVRAHREDLEDDEDLDDDYDEDDEDLDDEDTCEHGVSFDEDCPDCEELEGEEP